MVNQNQPFIIVAIVYVYCLTSDTTLMYIVVSRPQHNFPSFGLCDPASIFSLKTDNLNTVLN